MKLLDRIFGKKRSNQPDPTVDWPCPVAIEPELVPHEGRFCDLAFGAPMDAARKFGKPSRCRWLEDEYCELLYAQAGFQIEFEAGRLAYLAFFVNQPAAMPDVEGGFDAAVVKLRLTGGRTGQLSHESTRDDIERLFGSPARMEEEPDETILTYLVAGFTMEFEMQPEGGTLVRFNIYPATGS